MGVLIEVNVERVGRLEAEVVDCGVETEFPVGDIDDMAVEIGGGAND